MLRVKYSISRLWPRGSQLLPVAASWPLKIAPLGQMPHRTWPGGFLLRGAGVWETQVCYGEVALRMHMPQTRFDPGAPHPNLNLNRSRPVRPSIVARQGVLHLPGLLCFPSKHQKAPQSQSSALAQMRGIRANLCTPGRLTVGGDTALRPRGMGPLMMSRRPRVRELADGVFGLQTVGLPGWLTWRHLARRRGALPAGE